MISFNQEYESWRPVSCDLSGALQLSPTSQCYMKQNYFLKKYRSNQSALWQHEKVAANSVLSHLLDFSYDGSQTAWNNSSIYINTIWNLMFKSPIKAYCCKIYTKIHWRHLKTTYFIPTCMYMSNNFKVPTKIKTLKNIFINNT